MRIEEIARSYWDAEAGRDIDRVLEHFAENAVWIGPGLELHGHEEIKRYYLPSFERFPLLEVDVVQVFGSDDHAALEWSAAFRTHEAADPVPLRGVNLMRGDGQHITELRAYFDTAGLSS